MQFLLSLELGTKNNVSLLSQHSKPIFVCLFFYFVISMCFEALALLSVVLNIVS